MTAPTKSMAYLGLLKASPEELSDRHGIEFEQTQDELDDVQVAYVQVDGLRFTFTRHTRSPEPGAVAYVETGADTDDALEALGEPTVWDSTDGPL
jgi:hypothetical protein